MRTWTLEPKTIPHRHESSPRCLRYSRVPRCWAQELASKIEVKIRARIIGPSLIGIYLYLKGTRLYLIGTRLYKTLHKHRSLSRFLR
jgi:hypothetical protein